MSNHGRVRPIRGSLARQVLLLQLAVVLVTVGMVAAGVLVEAISAQVAHQLPRLLTLAALALLIGTLLSLLLARRVKRQSLGLEPSEIAALYEHHDAVLHAIREGVLVLDGDG